jgi:CheY-like chemotaxis protein
VGVGLIKVDTKAEVQPAASVSEALEMLEWFTPSVIVSDLAMPGEDGYSLIKKLRTLEGSKGVSIRWRVDLLRTHRGSYTRTLGWIQHVRAQARPTRRID